MALLTLTSDFGHHDYLVGAVKGQLAQINPAFNIMDISHELSPFNYPQAAYICRNAIRNFPSKATFAQFRRCPGGCISRAAFFQLPSRRLLPIIFVLTGRYRFRNASKPTALRD